MDEIVEALRSTGNVLGRLFLENYSLGRTEQSQLDRSKPLTIRGMQKDAAIPPAQNSVPQN
jgi:hypothetical protein